MTTQTKDFVVKNGLVVGQGAVFGDTITIPDPTADSHAATKSYVDSIAGGSSSVLVSATAPESPSGGDFWLNSTNGSLNVFFLDSWIALATKDENLLYVPNHIHDESTGELLFVIVDGGDPETQTFETNLSGGNPESVVFVQTLDGGSA